MSLEIFECRIRSCNTPLESYHQMNKESDEKTGSSFARVFLDRKFCHFYAFPHLKSGRKRFAQGVNVVQMYLLGL